MISILLGPDDYTKKAHISSFAKKIGAEVEVFNSVEKPPRLRDFLQQSLFSGAKVYVVEGLFLKVDWQDSLDAAIASPNKIFIVENKLDKRMTAAKVFFADKRVTIQEFPLPHGKELDTWIQKRAGELKGSIIPEAASTLASLLGRDSAQEKKIAGKIVEVTEVYSLWQVNSELSKLISYANGKNITPEMVKEIVCAGYEINVMEITDALAAKDRKKALSLIHNFLTADTASDEKSSIIQLAAILAEQLRSIAIVEGFLSSNTPENIILEKTGWKSGRLFIMKKIASRFSPKSVKETLVKLDALDTELKTGSTPPRVLLDMIVAQIA